MKKVDIIVPVHKYDTDVKSLLTRCLTSIKNMAVVSKGENIVTDIVVVGPSLPSDEILKLVDWTDEFASFNVVDNTTGNIDFCSQVNLAVNEVCKNDYFMVVEYDDMVTPKWLIMAAPYVEKRKKISVFLPLVELRTVSPALR